MRQWIVLSSLAWGMVELIALQRSRLLQWRLRGTEHAPRGTV